MSSSSSVGNIAPNDGSSSPPASAIVAQAMSGSHVVKIDGYSRTKGLGNGKYIKSETFTIGCHPWCMRYYPDGCVTEDADWISIYLHYSTAPTNAGEVKAEFKISLLDHDRQPVALYSRCSQGFGYQSKFQDFPCSQLRTFSTKDTGWGFGQFIKRKDLEESPYLRDDVFSIRCDVTVSKEIFTEPIPQHVVVPPSNMHHHLGQLLLAGEAADVTFEVGEETFAAHRCILAARSPVFKAELLGPMKEKTATRVLIDDMEARVFKALLHFIYTDSLPAMDEGGAAEIAQHLLVAADRYDMERLKLICEGKLCDHICKSTVATTLALAEQHGCGALKKACFKFLMSPGNLKVVMESDGYEHLRSSCPSVLDELVAKLAP
ncbi:BTB/POZ and MATH domain-containing protein 2-like [Aegilops tauschii subsp. strangulata]|uniref:BTB/POZ and MATH domain-containing protein 2-like n=1 Tax=Aegilops tauschii subsp. strangulata TaxID=200361 RepID=UPI00098A3C28|nr:BTB/POZ and MATH domain-containing protein 2-like [Aegilops tauschii subsp. strangulata]